MKFLLFILGLAALIYGGVRTGEETCIDRPLNVMGLGMPLLIVGIMMVFSVGLYGLITTYYAERYDFPFVKNQIESYSIQKQDTETISVTYVLKDGTEIVISKIED